MTKRRARCLGLDFPGTPGPHNAITDVPGVEVGYRTLLEGSGELVVGEGPVRTGVTAILPRGRGDVLTGVQAGFHALNGNGEMTGVHWIHDAGYFCGPICLTNTHSVGIAHHAVTRWLIDTNAAAFREQHLWALPVVAETYDGILSDINGQHVRERHVTEAIESAAGGALPQGNVGGGTGMVCYEFKGGTGTASRWIDEGDHTYTVGVLVQANHGIRDWLTILGAPVGRHLREDLLLNGEQGSIVVIIATDAPMLPHQLQRLARRAAIGIGRNGTPGGNRSGDIFLGFSTANPVPPDYLREPQPSIGFLPDNRFDPYYLAVVEATEEATVNALVAAEDMPTLKPAGRVCRAIPHAALIEAMSRYGGLREGAY